MVGKPIVPLRCRLPGRHLRGRGLLGLAGVVALGGWLAAGTALAQASETLPMGVPGPDAGATEDRSEEHTSELQSLMRISYAVFCLKKKKQKTNNELVQRTTT